MENYTNLIVWKKAMLLVKEVYNLIKRLPKVETYALSDQMRRAAVSIPSNIAEGYCRSGSKETKQFLYYAKGSAAELSTQLRICQMLEYLSSEDIKRALDLCEQTQRMLSKIIQTTD